MKEKKCAFCGSRDTKQIENGIQCNNCDLITTSFLKKISLTEKDNNKIDLQRFKKISLEVQEDFKMGGLAGTIYEEYAQEILIKYLELNK